MLQNRVSNYVGVSSIFAKPLTRAAAFSFVGQRHTLSGNIQTHSAFRSAILQNERDILVYLPPGYRRATSRRYPVLYLHDGQNVFDAATAFGGVEWRADETAQELIKQRLIEPLIIVAVANMGEDRIHEYTPTRGKVTADGGSRARSRGLLRKYGRFLVEELKPFIDATYRTRPEKESTGVGGSSLGGLASLVLGFWFPQTFTRIAALSPSIWWDDSVILGIVDESEEPPRSSRIWLDTGTHEEGWERVGGLRDHLVWSGWRLYGELQYLEVANAEHSEQAWAQRFEGVLRFLYPPQPPPLKTRSRKPIVAMAGVVPVKSKDLGQTKAPFSPQREDRNFVSENGGDDEMSSFSNPRELSIERELVSPR